MSKLKYASFTLTLRQPYAAEIAALSPRGRGRPRLRVMDVRTEMLAFPGFRGPDRSFCPRTSAGIIRVDVRRISGPKTYSLVCFSCSS